MLLSTLGDYFLFLLTTSLLDDESRCSILLSEACFKLLESLYRILLINLANSETLACVCHIFLLWRKEVETRIDEDSPLQAINNDFFAALLAKVSAY